MIEYKVINTMATGVPSGSGKTYDKQFESGLNELGKQGWILSGIIGGTLLVFYREKRDGRITS